MLTKDLSGQPSSNMTLTAGCRAQFYVLRLSFAYYTIGSTVIKDKAHEEKVAGVPAAPNVG